MKQIITLMLISSALVSQERPTMFSQSLPSDVPLSANPEVSHWKVTGVIAATDPFGTPLPEARTEIRSRWTSKHLYFLFISHYQTLYSRPNPDPKREAWGLWDYDVAEVFIGHDLKNIHQYKEFEVSPDGEFIDLDVDQKRVENKVDWLWNSKFQYKTKIDREKKIWICEMQIPWDAIAPKAITMGQEFRLNLYRIEGGPKHRKFITWSPVGNPSFHTPEKFGRLILQ